MEPQQALKVYPSLAMESNLRLTMMSIPSRLRSHEAAPTPQEQGARE
jgi:hypothetical protein